MAVINNNDDLTSLLKTQNLDPRLQELFDNTYTKFSHVLDALDSTSSNHRILMLKKFGSDEFKGKFNEKKVFNKSNNLDHIKLNYIDLITDGLNKFEISPDDSDHSDDMDKIINKQGSIDSSDGISSNTYIDYNELINNISIVDLKYYKKYLTFDFKTPLLNTKPESDIPESDRTEQDYLLEELYRFNDKIGDLHVYLINKLNEVPNDDADNKYIKKLFSGREDINYSEEIRQFKNQIIKDVYYNYYVLRKSPEDELIETIKKIKTANKSYNPDIKLKYIDCSFPLLHDKQEFRIKYKYYFLENINKIKYPVSCSKDEKVIIERYHQKKNDFFFGIYSLDDDDDDEEESNTVKEFVATEPKGESEIMIVDAIYSLMKTKTKEELAKKYKDITQSKDFKGLDAEYKKRFSAGADIIKEARSQVDDDDDDDDDDDGNGLFRELGSENADREIFVRSLDKEYLSSNYYDIGFGINGNYDSEGNYKYIVSSIKDESLIDNKDPIKKGMVITHIGKHQLLGNEDINSIINNILKQIKNASANNNISFTFIKNVTINPINKKDLVNIKDTKDTNTNILNDKSHIWLNKIYNYYITKIARIIKYQIVNMIYITIEDLLKQIILPIDKQLNKIILSNILISNDINKESIYINLYYNLIDECLIFGLINQTKENLRENLREKISEDAIFKLIKFIDYYTCKHKFTTEKFIKNKNNEMLLYNSTNKEQSFFENCKAKKDSKLRLQISPLRQNNCRAAIDILLNSKITWFDVSAPICLDLESELDETSSTSEKKLNEHLINTKYSNEINHFRLIINSKLQYFARKFNNDTELLGKVKLTGLRVIYAINYFIKDRYLFLLLSIIDIKNPDRKPKEFLYKLHDVRADWHIKKSVYKWYYHEIESGNEINDLSSVLKVLDKDEMIIAGWKKLHYFDGAQKVGSDDEKKEEIAEGSNKHKGNVITHISQVIFEHSEDVPISGLSRDGIADELWKRININEICNLLQIELIIENLHKDKINKLISYKSLISKLKGKIATNIEKIEQLKQECKEATEAKEPTEATEAKKAIEIKVIDDDINITLYICCDSNGKLKTWIITNQKFDDINKEFLEEFNKEIDELTLSFDNSNEPIESNTEQGIKDAIEEECTNAKVKAAQAAINDVAAKELAEVKKAEEAEAAKAAEANQAEAAKAKAAEEAKKAKEAKQRSITVTLNEQPKTLIFPNLGINKIFITEYKNNDETDQTETEFKNLYPVATEINVNVRNIKRDGNNKIIIPLGFEELKKFKFTPGLTYYKDAETKKYINLGVYESNYNDAVLRNKDEEAEKETAEKAEKEAADEVEEVYRV